MKFRDYIKGDRRGRGAHRIELEAMRDPLLHDAIEGFDKVPGDHDKRLERLAARIAARAGADGAAGQKPPRLHRRRVRNWSVAAAVTLLVCLAGGGLLFLKKYAGPGGEILTQEIQEIGLPAADTVTEISAGEKSESVELMEVMKFQKPESSSDGIARQVPRDDLEIKSADKDLAASDRILVPPVLHDAAVAGSAAEEEAAKIAEFAELADETMTAAGESRAKQESGRLAGDKLLSVKSIPPADTLKLRGAVGATTANSLIKGRVIDSESGEPLAGAVVSKGNESILLTDPDGYFVLSKNDQIEQFRVQSLGYEDKVVEADTSGVMLIAMAPSSTTLNDVVVVGFGQQRKVSVVGAVGDSGLRPNTTMTPEFRRYMEEAVSQIAEEDRPDGEVVIEFEVNSLGRPYRINVVESPSAAARRLAMRLLREGPDWESDDTAHRITMTFK